MSIVAPTAALSGAVPVIVGFAQGERPATLQLVGMAVAGAGVLLAVRTPEPAGGGARRAAGRPGASATPSSAALFLGLLVTSLDAAGEASPLWASLMVRVVSVPLFVVGRGPHRAARDGDPPAGRRASSRASACSTTART